MGVKCQDHRITKRTCGEPPDYKEWNVPKQSPITTSNLHNNSIANLPFNKLSSMSIEKKALLCKEVPHFFFVTFLSKSTFRMQKNSANANTLGDLSDSCKVGDFQPSKHGSVVEMNFVEIYLAKHGRNELCGEPKSCTALVKFV